VPVAITWDDAPENQFPILGEDFAIKCKVRARPSPIVDWLYNGEVIRTNDHYVIETHALKIKNVKESDDGVYSCRAAVTETGELKERIIRVEVRFYQCLQLFLVGSFKLFASPIRFIDLSFIHIYLVSIRRRSCNSIFTKKIFSFQLKHLMLLILRTILLANSFSAFFLPFFWCFFFCLFLWYNITHLCSSEIYFQ
jgi:hypothetical protein